MSVCAVTMKTYDKSDWLSPSSLFFGQRWIKFSGEGFMSVGIIDKGVSSCSFALRFFPRAMKVAIADTVFSLAVLRAASVEGK